MRPFILLFVFALAGCAGYAPEVVDISDSQARINYSVERKRPEVDAKATEACALYGKTAVYVSDQCASGDCYIRQALYACQ